MNVKKLIAIGMVGGVCVVIVGGIAYVVKNVCDDMTTIINKVVDKCCLTVEGLVNDIVDAE